MLDIGRGFKGLTFQNCRAMKRMIAYVAVNPCEDRKGSDKKGGKKKAA